MFATVSVNSKMYLKSFWNYVSSVKHLSFTTVSFDRIDSNLTVTELTQHLKQLEDQYYYFIVQGWFKHLLFMPTPLNNQLKYTILIKHHVEEVSIHTMGVLSLNHTWQNRMPFYVNLDKTVFTKMLYCIFKYVKDSIEFEYFKNYLEHSDDCLSKSKNKKQNKVIDLNST